MFTLATASSSSSSLSLCTCNPASGFCSCGRPSRDEGSGRLIGSIEPWIPNSHNWVPPEAPTFRVPEGWEAIDGYIPPTWSGIDSQGRGEDLTVIYFKRKKGHGIPEDDQIYAYVRHEFWDEFPSFQILRSRARTCKRSSFILDILTKDRDYRDWKYYDLCPRDSDSHEVFVRFSLDAVPVTGRYSEDIRPFGWVPQHGDLVVLCPTHAPSLRFSQPASHSTCAYDPEGKAWGHRKFRIQLSSSDLAEQPQETDREDNFFTSNAFATAQNWVDQCRSDLSHVFCGRDKGGFIPKRLLNIKRGIQDLTIEEHVQGQDIRGYATLSYCWGLPKLASARDNITGTTRYFTTKANLSRRLQGFSGAFESFPKTILDAIDIARALKFEHIWIDSLCILQDPESRHDWESEASQMCHIYGQSDLTIVASASVDASEGIISGRRRPVISGDFVLFDRRLYFRSAISAAAVQPCPRFRWKNRGWTMQEETLSNRILYFTENDRSFLRDDNAQSLLLEFECRQNHRRPDGVGKRTFSLPSTTRPWLPHQGQSRDELAWAWRNIVENYSSRTLTKRSDIFPALEGVAREMSKGSITVARKYVAGLWSTSIMIDLCWSTASSKVLKDRLESTVWTPDPPRGQDNVNPSWTWASLEVASGVRWDRTLERYGYRTLGHVRPGILGEAYSKSRGMLSTPTVTFGTLTGCKLLPGHKVTSDLSDRDCWVLFLIVGEDRDDDGDRWNVYHGIVLEKRPTGEGYCRIGSISVGQIETVSELLGTTPLESCQIY